MIIRDEQGRFVKGCLMQHILKRKGKTYEEIYGEDKAIIIKDKKSKSSLHLDRSYYKYRAPKTAFKKGQKPWNKGLTKEDDERIIKNAVNISKTLTSKPRYDLRGDKHPNWKGGIYPHILELRHSIEYRIWREAVFKRDNYTCRKCDRKGIINAHHIKSFIKFPELRFNIDNGITLCLECHRQVKHIVGEEEIR